MRNALLISLAFHVAVSLASVRLVRISKVRFVPRQVYSVQLVSVTEMEQKRREEPKAEPAPPKPVPIEEEETPEDLVPPPEKKKPPPKKKPEPEKKKVIPSTEIKKVETPEPEDSVSATPTPSTGDIALDVDEFPFAYYLATIKRKIASLWNVPAIPGSDGMYCKVYFRISRSGAIQSPVVESGSSNFLFDQAALRAVVQSNPLPPLPEGFEDDYLGVHFNFAYEKE
jgi:protein TonB